MEFLKSEANTGNGSLINELCDLNNKILGKDYSFLDTLSNHLLEKSNSLYWLDNYHININSNNNVVQLNYNDKLREKKADEDAADAQQENTIRKTKKMKRF